MGAKILYQRVKAVFGFKQALRFFGPVSDNATESKIQLPNQSYFDFGSGNFCFSLWAYCIPRGSITFAGVRYGIIGWRRSGINSGTCAISLNLSADGTTGTTIIGLALQFRTSAGVRTVAATGMSLHNSWHHYVFQRSGTALQVYVDSVLKGSTTITASETFTSQGNFNVVGGAEGTNNFNGYMDDFCIFNRALSLAEIQAIYNSGQGAIPDLGTFSNIISYWRFDASNGRVLTDYTSLYNNLYNPGNGSLLNYTDAQVAANGQPQSGQTAWVDHFTLAPITS